MGAIKDQWMDSKFPKHYFCECDVYNCNSDWPCNDIFNKCECECKSKDTCNCGCFSFFSDPAKNISGYKKYCTKELIQYTCENGHKNSKFSWEENPDKICWNCKYKFG